MNFTMRPVSRVGETIGSPALPLLMQTAIVSSFGDRLSTKENYAAAHKDGVKSS